ncbi:MAG TPA: cache domain-containing protein [Burkholderiales bacterium]|nr:cache domain-containing protein [Burkholderiales bacterium]
MAWSACAVALDDDCSNAPPEEAEALMLKAAAQVERLGHSRAFANFMNPEGGFFPRDLYVFVVDLEGHMWVNGAFPQFIGTNALGTEDPQGVRYIEAMLKTAAEKGTGRVEYLWLNPCTGGIARKLTFFRRVGRYVVAVGAYVGAPQPRR